MEQWAEYVTTNRSRFPAIEEEDFFAGTRVLVALIKIGNHYLKKDFRHTARQFLEEFTNSVLSIVAARFNIGQGFSCFPPVTLVGGENHAPLLLFGLQLDVLREVVVAKQ